MLKDFVQKISTKLNKLFYFCDNLVFPLEIRCESFVYEL